MKKIISSIFLLLVLSPIIYVTLINRSLIPDTQKFLTESVCDVPLTYHIATVDPQFGKSKESFQQDIDQAVTNWKTATGKELFRADPQGDIAISFVYDTRQSLTNDINSMEGKVKQDDSSIKEQIAAYEAKVADLNNRIVALNKDIDSWNAKGGAPEDVFQQLKKRQSDLRIEGATLNQEAKRLNLSTQNFNAQVSNLNNTINTFNSTIKEKPEEGLYDPNNNTITIYFYNDQNELVHTLMHELGHARGLAHVSDENGIMYPYTTTFTTPTVIDLAALTSICKQKYVTYTWQNYLMNLRIYFQTVMKTHVK